MRQSYPTAVYSSPQKQVVRVRGVSAVLEQPQEVVVLAVNVTCARTRTHERERQHGKGRQKEEKTIETR